MKPQIILSCPWIVVALTIGIVIPSASPATAQPVQEWTRKLGSSSSDFTWSASADVLGNVYFGGFTTGALGGPKQGFDDAFVSKFDSSGVFQWTRQIGTSQTDVVRGVSADGLGNVYVSGSTSGSLESSNLGESDAFVRKYDSAGNALWTRQFGTSTYDESYALSAIAADGVYVAGRTSGNLGGASAGLSDAYVRKFDVDGNLLWTRQFGTSSEDIIEGVAADGLGNVYVSGNTGGTLAGSGGGQNDAFLRKYDAAGNLEWTRQVGTSNSDTSRAVAADALGNIFIGGFTGADLAGPNFGDWDAFVLSFDASGNLNWSRQLGTAKYDELLDLAADGVGGVYASGRTTGNLGGVALGEADAFVSRLDATGAPQWTKLLGSENNDEGHGIAFDGLHSLYLAGPTNGNLGGPQIGNDDAFLIKFREVPEPTSWLVALSALAGLVWSRRPRVVGPNS